MKAKCLRNWRVSKNLLPLIEYTLCCFDDQNKSEYSLLSDSYTYQSKIQKTDCSKIAR